MLGSASDPITPNLGIGFSEMSPYFIGLCAIFLGLLTLVHSDTDSKDVGALNVLFTSLNSPKKLKDWSSSGGDPCGDGWKGIECSGSSVTEIKLAGFGLSGSLGYKLGDLHSVTYFDVSNNKISGDIPYQLPPSVTHLDLSDNSFSGNVPYSISQMSNLKDLDLSHNQLNGQLTDMFSKLQKLDFLYLQNNQFSGHINVLAKLPIEDLNLANNQFTGYIPNELANIKSIDIEGNSWSSGTAPAGMTTSDNVHSTHKGKLSGAMIAAIVMGILLVLAIILAIISKGRSSFSSSLAEEHYSIGHKSFKSYGSNRYSCGLGTDDGKSFKGFGCEKTKLFIFPRWPSGKVSELVSSISKIYHPNVVELSGYCSEQGHNMLVYGYFRNGSLHEFLHLSDEFSKPLTWNTRVKIALGIARAIEYLHEICSPPLVHRSIKSSNILLDMELNPRLSDCGLAAYYQDATENLGAGYSAPECKKGSAYTFKGDVYSFGVVMLELLTGRMPFDSSKPIAEQYVVQWATPQLYDIDALDGMVDPALRGLYPPKSISRFADIIALCVQVEPEFRPLISEVVQSLQRLLNQS